MKHFGDITKINGADVPIVDIVTGGSPCQDLSVAGKREGLKKKCHNYITCGFETDANSELERCPWCGSYLDLTRSGLFMEQIRIIKEMREHDRANGRTNECVRPRFMVWENVPGAFSSNKGEDFRAVLEETARVADKDAVIPEPECNKGKWTPAGCIMADGWSIAWRVHDAQFWGVPQRRKRISLVADFGGATAPEILFERKGMSGDIETCGEEGKDAAEDAERGIRETVAVLNDQGGSVMSVSEDVTGALRAQEHGHQPIVYGMAVVQGADMYNGSLTGDIAATLNASSGDSPTHSGPSVVCLEGNGSRPSHKGDGYAESETMYTLNSTEHHAVAVENHPADSRVKISEDGKVQTLSSRMGTGGGNVPMVLEPYTSSKAYHHQHFTNNGKAETLVASDYKDLPTVTYGLDRAAYNQGMNAQFDFAVDEEKIGTQVAKGPGAGFGVDAVVRRLTPLECERLQGFPDNWTDIGDWVDSKGKKHKGESDAPRYKALGNSIALPFWKWMAKRMVRFLKNEEPTMASLFDGISGFCLAFARAGVKPIFSSEIEEFPIAVAKKHFGDDDLGLEGDYERYL